MASDTTRQESSDSSVTSENDHVERTVDDLISRLNEDEVLELLNNRQKLRYFTLELLKCQRHWKKEKEIRNLLEIIKKISARSGHLQRLIDDFLFQRKELLTKLKNFSGKMDIITKICNAGKLASSAIDSVGIIGNSVIKRTNSLYVNVLFEIANAAGLIGFGAAAVELMAWRAILDELVIEIQKDQDLFAPIQEWFQQNYELEQAVQAIFPINSTADIVKKFEESVETNISNADLLQTVLGAVLRDNPTYIRNATLIENVRDFIACPEARHCVRWVFFRHHKVTLDVARMLLQLMSPQKLVSSQNVGTLTRFGSNSQTVSVVGRVGLNCINMYDAVCTLKHGGMVEEMRRLQKHLQQEMVALIHIARMIQQNLAASNSAG